MNENNRIKILLNDDPLVVKYEDVKEKDCPNCGAIHYKHTFCPSCGTYFCDDCGYILMERKK